MSGGRLGFAKRNVGFGLVSSVANLVVGFVSRTVFISALGSEYLGVNALMANVLGVLSFLELGMGSALNYSMYKPLADGDVEKVRALARFYRKVYRVIALVITVVGLALLPVIPLLAKESEGLGDLRLYYLLFLASNVVSYFAVYKTSIANADQRSYLMTNIHTISSILTSLAQVAILLVWGDYLLFLIVMLVSRLLHQVALHVYLGRRYAEFLREPASSLAKDELDPIKKNVKALVWHRLGEVSVHQTDSIVIAAFVNVATLGLVSNYNLIISTVTLFLSVAVNAVTGSFGNAVASESPERVYQNYKVYRFIAFWLYGVASIGLFVLITPLVVLWIGPNMVIGEEIVFLVMLNFYMLGHRATINTMKTAAGVWNPDKYLAFAQAVINIVVSIALVQVIGLAGVYVGTIVQGLAATIIKPLIVYPRIFNAPAREYFIDGAKYFAIVLTVGASLSLVVRMWLQPTTWAGFLMSVIVVIVVTSAAFYLPFRGSAEWRTVSRRVLHLPGWRRQE